MLSKLTIDNYALIDKSVIDFRQGFTVITGETGAGKSIMLDALALLMGARADSKSIGNKDRKMIVEAIFNNPDPLIKKVCNDNNIDWDPNELILRREISSSGKSRGFINDSPVNLSVLNSVSQYLLDIHSQHNNILLNNPQKQLSIIDSYARNETILAEYQNTFRSYVNLRNKIKNIKENIQKGKENLEFIKFRLEQLDKIKPKRGELESLEREADILGDADSIKSDLILASSLIASDASSALHSLQSASNALGNIDFQLLDPYNSESLSDRLNSIKIELRDISDTLEGYAEKIESDPEKLDKVQSRIDTLYEAMKHFRAKDEEELVSLYEHLKEELSSISQENIDLSSLELQLKDLAKILKEQAEKLSTSRMVAAEKFTHLIESKLFPLGLPNIKFKVEIQKGKLTSDGQDLITFYCTFNKNHPLQPVNEIASGGEISRLMLGIKSIMAENMNLPTIIFDEIDTGVSGEIAHKMGRMMKEMASNIQVISVTHLPQVAASGSDHLKVYKSDDENKTVSHIRRLDNSEREKEIAGMLSGSKINPAALENARQLMKS